MQHQKPHAEQQNGTAAASRAADPPARQSKVATSSTATPSTARHASHAGPSQQPLAHSQQHKQPMNSSMQFAGDPKHLSADPKQPQQPSQNAPPGSSLQSAQTALPQKPSKGKPAKAPAPAAASLLTDEVVQQVCAAARIGQKETVLIALLQCKPCKNQVCTRPSYTFTCMHMA